MGVVGGWAQNGEVIEVGVSVFALLSLAMQCPDGSAPPCTRAAVVHPPPATSVAVLYFENLSRDTADAYLADGLTEEIIVRLGQMRRLEVKSRYEVQRFRGRPGGDPRALGTQLGAANIVTGSLQRVGTHVRVTVELVRAASRTRVWGDVYDRSSADVLNIEEEIAGAVVQGVAGQMIPEERAALARHPTRSAEAYDLYLRGRALVARFDGASLHGAIALFEQAFALDSNFAEAEAAVADAWTWLADVFEPPRESYPKARRAAERAIRIDSSNATAWAALAAISFFYEWAPARADSMIRQALAQDPRSPQAYEVRGEASLYLGSNPEGVGELEHAYELDSLSDNVVANVIGALIEYRQYPAASELISRYQRAHPGSSLGYATERAIYLLQGDCGRALALSGREQAMGMLDTATDFYELHCRHEDEKARRRLGDLIQIAQTPGKYYPPIRIAEKLALLGDREQCLAWLEQSVQAREGLMRPNSQAWDFVRDDPRFKALLQRMVPQPVERF